MTELDLDLKLAAASALARSGYFCRVNVCLSAHTGEALADVTDVDVLAIRHDLTFAPRLVAVSCKSGGSLSVSKELFYMRGVLDYLHGDEGVVLLAKKTVAQQLRDLGRRLDLLCLQGDEVDEWIAAMTRGLPEMGYFSPAGFAAYSAATDPEPGNNGLLRYLRTEYWFHRDFRNIQNVIAHLRKAPRSKRDNTGVKEAVRFLDTAAHFALTLMDLCRHVQLVGVARVAATVPSYLFGGETNLKARRDLYQKLVEVLQQSGIADPATLPGLIPAYVPHLHELVARFIARPQSAVLVPQVLQNSMWQWLGVTGWDADYQEQPYVLAAMKLADDLLDFLGAAAERQWVPTIVPVAPTSRGVSG